MLKNNPHKVVVQLFHSAPLKHPHQYRGVGYIRGARKPWKATITRVGISIWLGNYATSDEAAEAADNGSYYTKQWSRHTVSYNFPDRWMPPEGGEVPKANRFTLAGIGMIKAKVPDLAAKLEKSNARTPAERLEEIADLIAGNIITFAEQLRVELRVAAAELRLAASRDETQREEIARLERTVKGLQVMGGTQFFKSVGGTLVPATEVDHHLEP